MIDSKGDPSDPGGIGPTENPEPPFGGILRVLLVGFMGSGKTSVGRCLAKRLKWGFRDFDEEISSRVGLSIPEIFRQHGEGFFRDLERKVGKDLLQLERVVLGSGGGWPGSLGRMEELPSTTLSVWLQVTPDEALRRVRGEGQNRPMLAVPDPLGRAKALLRERETFYRLAHTAIDTARADPESVAETIYRIMKTTGLGGNSLLPLHK